MPQKTNLVIDNAYSAKTGESKYGPWTLYKITFVGGQKEFGYFYKNKGPIPRQGMKVAFVRWEEVQNGEYINNNIKELKLDENAPAVPITESNGNGKKAYIDHGKVVLELMTMAAHSDKPLDSLKNLIKTFNFGIEYMMEGNTLKEPEKVQPEAVQNVTETFEGEVVEEPDEDDIPF